MLSPLASSAFGIAKKLSLKVLAAPVSQKMSCNHHSKVEVSLTLLNATAPSCGQIKPERLCFPDQDTNPHIKENRLPGALRQLRRFTHADICVNYTISYKLKTGTYSTTPKVIVDPTTRNSSPHSCFPTLVFEVPLLCNFFLLHARNIPESTSQLIKKPLELLIQRTQRN